MTSYLERNILRLGIRNVLKMPVIFGGCAGVEQKLTGSV